MIHLDLTDEEEQTLREALRQYLSELDMEIAHTDRAEFRTMLKQRKAVLKKLFDRLPEGASPKAQS